MTGGESEKADRTAKGTERQTDLNRQSYSPEMLSETGRTQDGVPLSINRRPDARLDPWIGRSMVAYAYEPTRHPINGLLCNDASYLRTAVGVDWNVGTADGMVAVRDQTFLTGQHTKAMPLRYAGGVKVAGLMLRPGAMRALFGIEDAALVDRLRPIEEAGISDSSVTGLYNLELEPEQWLARLESWLADHIERNDIKQPDQLTRRVEEAAFANPNVTTRDLADANGVELRTLQRICKRDFGLSPKHIMRRARVLDLAARLCGVADEEEADEFLARYFDQAHLIRDFSSFFGTSPKQFAQERQALLTLSLEIRQARRLELLDRIEPGAVRPWMRRPFRPVNAQAS